MFTQIRKLVCGLTLASLVGSAGLASANYPAQGGNNYGGNHYNGHNTYYQPPQVRYMTVVVWENRQVPTTEYVTRYDHCNQPYRAAVTVYKTVRVAVEKRIAVNY